MEPFIELWAHMTRHRVHWVKHDVIHKTISTWHIATPTEQDRATDTSNIHKNRWRLAVWFSWCPSRQTDKQTDVLIAILRIHPGSEVMKSVGHCFTNVQERRIRITNYHDQNVHFWAIFEFKWHHIDGRLFQALNRSKVETTLSRIGSGC